MITAKSMATKLGYHIIRSKKRKKTISLCLQRDGIISIYAPYSISKHAIERFFESKKPWIYKKLAQSKLKPHKPKKFIPGESFLYLGKSYPLEIQDSGSRKKALEFSHNRFILHRNYTGYAKEFFARWYKEEANMKINERIKFYSQNLQLFPEALRISSAEYRWGSCSHKNVLSFTWRLVMAPLPVIDYVVVHELLHMKERNHSRKFWMLLQKILPDYKKQRQWLKDNGHCLTL